MTKLNYILSIALAMIMLSSCEDSNAIDNTGTGEAEIFSLTFGTEESVEDGAAKSATRIAANVSSNVAFSWIGNENITVVDMTPTSISHTFSSLSSGSFEGDLPIKGLIKEDGATANINVYAYAPKKTTEIAVKKDPVLVINSPLRREFHLISGSSDAEKAQVYGSVLPFVSAPIENEIEWDGTSEKVFFTSATSPNFDFRPIFTTIRLCLSPNVKNIPSNRSVHSITATIEIGESNGFDTEFSLDMKKFKQGSTTAEKTNAAGTSKKHQNKKTSFITYSEEINLVDLFEKTPLVVPIFATRTKDVVKFFRITLSFKNKDGQQVLGASREYSNSARTTKWEYGEVVNISLNNQNASWNLKMK